MKYDYTKVEINNHIAYLIFNDTAKRNAFSPKMVKEIVARLEDLRYDPAARVIVLRGAEGNFCGGADVSAMADKAYRLKNNIPLDEDPRLNMNRLVEITNLIRTYEKPVIAWLEGAVAGAGMSVAMACDFSYADVNCKMLFAFAKIGLVPDMGATYLLTRRVGVPRATELFMTGKRFTGAEAAEWGIITGAYENESLEEAVKKQAEQLAVGPALAYDKIKKLINRAVYADMENSMLLEMEYQQVLNKSEDHLGAIDAFLEKRAPVFNGK